MFNNLTIKLRLTLLIAFMSAVLLITNGFGLAAINSSNDSIESLYSNRLISTKSLGFIRAKAMENRLLLNASFIFQDEAQKNADTIEKNLEEVRKSWEIYTATPSTPEEAELIKKYLIDRQRYLDEGLKPAIEMMKKGEEEKLAEHIHDKIRGLFTPFYMDLEGLIQIQDDSGQAEYGASQSDFQTVIWVLLGLVIVALLAALIINRKITSGILKSIREVQEVANAIASGNLNTPIDSSVKDETGAMLQSMQRMQNTLVSFADAQQVMAKKHSQGWTSERIDTLNFKGSYGEMARSINELAQSHIDVTMHIVDVVTDYAKGNFIRNIDSLPGEKAKITKAISEVKTALLAINTEIESLAEAGARGDFSKRANTNNFDFMFKTMLTHLNTLIETCDGAFGDVVRVSNALANGDLTQAITKNYPGIFGQVKDGMNGTTENLKTVMSEIKETTEVISSVAKEIASGNNDLSHRTEEQAASLEETAASMHELTSTVQHNTENAKQANELAVGAAQTANKGVSVVQDVVSTMDNINESSLRIVDIISVIDDIAFQTNILALNAAVEAARAGEQGKGFAVVATEVRNLAQRAANAAGEIKRLINDSVERVSGGSRQVAEAGKTMQDIVDAIGKVTSIISEIASASEQQNAGIAQVGQAIGSMDEVTQQNAALVEEVAATAESLESQTSHLAKEMSHFKTGNEKGHVSKTVSPVKSAPTPKATSPVKKVESSSVGTFSVGADDWEEF